MISSMNNFSKLSAQASQEVSDKVNSQLSLWNSWTNNQASTIVNNEAAILEQIRTFSNNVLSYVHNVLNNANSTLTTVQQLKVNGNSSTSATMNSFQTAVNDLTNNISSASAALEGDSG